MINVHPIHFTWPITGNQDPLVFLYDGGITIKQLQEYMQREQSLDQIVTVAYDNLCEQILEPQMSLEELGVPPDCQLYLFKNPIDEQEQDAQQIAINLVNERAYIGQYKISMNATLKEVHSYIKKTIDFLVQNTIIPANPISCEMKVTFSQLVQIDQSLKQNFTPLPQYYLYVNYDQIIINLINEGAYVGQYYIVSGSTVKETIDLLVYNNIIPANPTLVQVKDAQKNLLFTDQSLQFKQNPLLEYHLHVDYHQIVIDLFNEETYVGSYQISIDFTVKETIDLLVYNNIIPANPTLVQVKDAQKNLLFTDQSLQFKQNPLLEYHLHVDYHQIVIDLFNEETYVGSYQISIDSTVKQAIDLLVYNNIIPANPTLVQVKDAQKNLLFTDQSLQFKQNPLLEYHLHVDYHQIVIDLFNEETYVGLYQISIDFTVKEAIDLLVYNNIIPANPTLVQVKDAQKNLLFTDQSLQFKQNPLLEYHLHVDYHQIVIDLFNEETYVGLYQISIDFTVKEAIDLLVYNNIIPANPTLVQVKDAQKNLLFTDQSLQFKQNPLLEYHLHVDYHQIVIDLFNEETYVGLYQISIDFTVKEAIDLLVYNNIIPANPTLVQVKDAQKNLLSTDQSLQFKQNPLLEYHLHVDYHQIVIDLFNEETYVGLYQISIDFTVKETIDLLVYNNIIPANPTLVQVKDAQKNLLFTDQSLQFKSNPLPQYNLHVDYHQLVIRLLNKEKYVGLYQISIDFTVKEAFDLLVYNNIIPANATLVQVKDAQKNLLFTDQSLQFKSNPLQEYHLHVDCHQIVIDLFNEETYVGSYYISIDSTVKQTIDLLVYNNIIPANPTLVQVKDAQKNLLFTDQSLQFKSNPLLKYHLNVDYHQIVIDLFNEEIYVGSYQYSIDFTVKQIIDHLVDYNIIPANPTLVEVKDAQNNLLFTDQSLQFKSNPLPQYRLYIDYELIVFVLFNEGVYVGQYQISIVTTVKQTIKLLVHNNIIPANPTAVEVKDTQNNLLFTDQSYTYRFRPLPMYHLQVSYGKHESDSKLQYQKQLGKILMAVDQIKNNGLLQTQRIHSNSNLGFI